MLRNYHLILFALIVFVVLFGVTTFSIALILIIVLCLTLILIAIGVFNIQLSIFSQNISRIKTNNKVVFLTFDDGPDAESTNRVLDTLGEYCVKGTFFCVGNRVVENNEVVQRINREGHLIGSHTMNHSWKYAFTSVNDITFEIEMGKKTIEQIIGKKVIFFRPPWGVTNPAIAKVVENLGLISVGWSIRSLDTTIHDDNKVLNRILSQLKPGGIILLHDRLNSTSKLLPEIIKGIREKGYVIEPLNNYLLKD